MGIRLGATNLLNWLTRPTDFQFRWIGLLYFSVSFSLWITQYFLPSALNEIKEILIYLLPAMGWLFLLAHVFALVSRYWSEVRSWPDWQGAQWVLAV